MNDNLTTPDEVLHAYTTLYDRNADLKRTISRLDPYTLQTMFGDMTSSELRKVQAALRWVQGQL